MHATGRSGTQWRTKAAGFCFGGVTCVWTGSPAAIHPNVCTVTEIHNKQTIHMLIPAPHEKYNKHNNTTTTNTPNNSNCS